MVAVPPGGGIPAAVLTIPRRNNGPIVADLGGGQVISVQYTGFSGTRELETFRLLNHARNLADFKTALQYFDVGSQNFIYGDIEGNIGYFTTSEVPLREDLQANTVTGAPPWFIRNGQGGNEWLKDPNPDQFNGTGYLSLPASELPQTVNPRNGFVVNANNDTAGTTLDNNPVNQLRVGGQGIFYLGYSFDFGTRAGRITQALNERFAKGKVDRGDMEAIQADVKLLDAEVFTPYILGAFSNASQPGAPAALAALAADARVAEAVGRLQAWNFTTPTGVTTGYDAADVDGERLPPSAAEVQHSIAATIYSVWRGQAIRNGVDLTLERPRRADAGFGRGHQGVASPRRARRHRPVDGRLLRLGGTARAAAARAAPRLRDAEEPRGRARPAGGTGLPGGIQGLDQPERLRLGQAAPDRVRRSRGRWSFQHPERAAGLPAVVQRPAGVLRRTAALAWSTRRRTAHEPRRRTTSCSARARTVATSACRAWGRARSRAGRSCRAA